LLEILSLAKVEDYLHSNDLMISPIIPEEFYFEKLSLFINFWQFSIDALPDL
jgi:hypothetical protein